MFESDKRPRCPHCGEPAWYVNMDSRVRCEINLDGTAGKVLRAVKPKGEPEYVCGAGHRWKDNAATAALVDTEYDLGTFDTEQN